MDENKLLNDIYEKYGEYLEMAGENAPAIIINILSKMVIIEREEKNYLTRRLQHELNTRLGRVA